MRQFLLFVGAGGAAALVNIGSRLLFSRFLAYELAVALAYLVGMSLSFALNRRFVFTGAPGSAHAQYGRFALVNLAAFLQVWLVSVGLARFGFPAIGFAWHAETVAHVVGVLSPVATSFLLHKHFSFAGAEDSGGR
jgi:putative flippase GtrA